MRMCDVAGCTHCPTDGLSVELPKMQKYSDTAMAQHMKKSTSSRTDDRRTSGSSGTSFTSQAASSD
eukprot:4563754-Prymnesium_polylepis.1